MLSVLFLCKQLRMIMKKIYVSILASTLLFAACNNAPEGETAEVTEEQTVAKETPKGEPYKVLENSKIKFYGATPTHGHDGNFPVSTGSVYVDDGNITGGTFTVKLEDMVVTTEGLPDKKKADLKGHLLSPDFFNAETNPDVVFEITKVEVDSNKLQKVSGNLTMNGKTNNISFPARVAINEEILKVSAGFVINRKDWGMSYKNDESLGDDWIYDEVKMTIMVDAKK